MGAAAVWRQAAADPVFALCAALTLGVLFVNGWTDAPNAIATVVTGRVMPVGRALAIAAVLAACAAWILRRPSRAPVPGPAASRS